MKLPYVWLFLFLGLNCATGCGAPFNEGSHELPIRVRFHPADVGARYEMLANVTKPGEYAVSVDFYIRDLNEYFLFFDKKNTREESALLFNMMGMKDDPTSGKSVDIGVPATFRVELIRNSDQQRLSDALITRQRTMGTYMGRTTRLTKYELPPGMYTVRVSYLDGIHALFPLKGAVAFYNTASPK